MRRERALIAECAMRKRQRLVREGNEIRRKEVILCHFVWSETTWRFCAELRVRSYGIQLRRAITTFRYFDYVKALKVFIFINSFSHFRELHPRLCKMNLCGIKSPFVIDSSQVAKYTWAVFFDYPIFGLRSSPCFSGYSPQRFFRPSFRSKIHCFTQVYFRKGWAALPLPYFQKWMHCCTSILRVRWQKNLEYTEENQFQTQEGTNIQYTHQSFLSTHTIVLHLMVDSTDSTFCTPHAILSIWICVFEWKVLYLPLINQ